MDVSKRDLHKTKKATAEWVHYHWGTRVLKKGTRRSAKSCPIANTVSDEVGFRVLASPVAITSLYTGTTLARPCAAAARFMVYFDSGLYPELVENE